MTKKFVLSRSIDSDKINLLKNLLKEISVSSENVRDLIETESRNSQAFESSVKNTLDMISQEARYDPSIICRLLPYIIDRISKVEF